METIEALLTKQDVCELLGVKEHWLNAEITAGRIPYIRLGKRKMVRFRPSEIEKYLQSKKSQGAEDDRVPAS